MVLARRRQSGRVPNQFSLLSPLHVLPLQTIVGSRPLHGLEFYRTQFGPTTRTLGLLVCTGLDDTSSSLDLTTSLVTAFLIITTHQPCGPGYWRHPHRWRHGAVELRLGDSGGLHPATDHGTLTSPRPPSQWPMTKRRLARLEYFNDGLLSHCCSSSWSHQRKRKKMRMPLVTNSQTVSGWCLLSSMWIGEDDGDELLG